MTSLLNGFGTPNVILAVCLKKNKHFLGNFTLFFEKKNLHKMLCSTIMF